MKYLHKKYTLIPFLYFTNLHSKSRILIITDNASRLDMDLENLPIDLFYWMPENCEINLQSESNKNLLIAPIKPENFPKKKFSTIIFDVKKQLPAELLEFILSQDSELNDVIFLEWNSSFLKSLRDLPAGFGLTEYRNSTIKILQNKDSRENFNLRWSFTIEPDLAKPKYLIAPGFKTKISVTTSSALKRWLQKRGLFYLLPHSRLSVLSRNPEAGIIGHAICSIRDDREKGGELLDVIQEIYISTTDVLMIRISHENKNYYIRFPFGQKSVNRIRNSYRITGMLNKKGFDFVPQPVEKQVDTAFPFYIEEGIDAFSVENKIPFMDSKEVIHYYEKAQSKISEVHLAFGEHFEMTEVQFDEFIGSRMNEIVTGMQDSNLKNSVISRILDFLKSDLIGKRFLRSVCHGDFKIGNCLFNENRQIIGIIDWDMGNERDLTLFDISSLISKALRSRYHLDFEELFTKGEQLASHLIPPYSKYFYLTDTDFIPLFPAFLLYWIDRVYKQLTFGAAAETNWMKRHAVPVLRRLDSIL